MPNTVLSGTTMAAVVSVRRMDGARVLVRETREVCLPALLERHREHRGERRGQQRAEERERDGDQQPAHQRRTQVGVTRAGSQLGRDVRV